MRELLTTYLGGETDKPFRLLIKKNRDALCSTPASTKTDFHDCHPGGLLVHIIAVTDCALKTSKALGSGIDDASIVRVGLLHDLGKIGDGSRPYYTEQESSWHRNRGILYEINEELTAMSIPSRSLLLATQAGVVLSEDEWQAVLYINARYSNGWTEVQHKETPLLRITSFAKEWAAHRRNKKPTKTAE